MSNKTAPSRRERRHAATAAWSESWTKGFPRARGRETDQGQNNASSEGMAPAGVTAVSLISKHGFLQTQIVEPSAHWSQTTSSGLLVAVWVTSISTFLCLLKSWHVKVYFLFLEPFASRLNQSSISVLFSLKVQSISFDFVIFVFLFTA